MPKQAYLNELSFDNSHVPTEQGRELFERLFRLLREINRRSNGLTIIGHRRLTALSIGDCPVGVWLRGDRDRIRWLRALEDRAPFDTIFERIAEETGGAWEYRHGDQVAIGLGLAAWHGELAVSVDRSPWQTEWVDLECYTLSEADDGTILDKTTVASARHAAAAVHLEAHEDWLRLPAANLPRTPDELWLNRVEWYPNIAFVSRVEPQIRGLPASSPAFRQVAQKLSALQDSVSNWNGTGRPEWQIKVVPENEGRRQYCRFEDLDGEIRLFELHARYTPGANRIHFRLDAPNRRIVVAHVGRKLGI